MTAPWPWLVAGPGLPGAVVELRRNATNEELEAMRRTFKDIGCCGDFEIRRALRRWPWWVRGSLRVTRRHCELPR